jgi:hypothetical protein
VARATAVLLATALAGCRFDTGGVEFPSGDAGGDAARTADAARAVDGAVDPGDAQPPDAAPPPPPDAAPPFCPPDPDLVGCYRFDGDGADQSPAGQDAQLSAVSWAGGVVGSAVVTDAASLIRVAEHPGLDAQALTLELWVRPAELPTGGARAGLIDNDGQYGLFVYAGGEVRCSCAGQLTSYLAIEALVWSHVACTYDPMVGMALYVGGVLRASAPATGLPNTAGTGGLAIAGNSPSGDPLTGAVDELRVWRRARSAAEVCAAAGSC